MNAIDFFCGGGGITCGLIQSGINVILGIDSNPACKDTYENNNKVPLLCEDIQRIDSVTLVNTYPILNDRNNLLMVGCAPCQPFSLLRKGSINEHISVNLLNEFGRLVKQMKPAHIMVENVPGLKGRGEEILQEFLHMLEKNDYFVDYKVINAKDYGVPQNRRRFVLIASKQFSPTIPEPTHGKDLQSYKTVKDAISHFPSIIAGETHQIVPNHKSAALAPITMERIKATHKDGGSRLDWPVELQLRCHKNGFQGHTDVYGRMHWNKVSPTLTAKCFSISNGRFGHPEQDRAISLREAAAIQTFPDDYIFEGGVQEIGRQIGNAVPVLLSKILSSYILEEHNKLSAKKK